MGFSSKSRAHRAEQRTLTLKASENRCLLAVTLLPSSNGALAISPADQVTAQAQPLNLVVTTLTDKLDTTYDPANLSLRDAIAETNANPGTNTITFASSLNGSVINLSLGELAITDSVTSRAWVGELTIDGSSNRESSCRRQQQQCRHELQRRHRRADAYRRQHRERRRDLFHRYLALGLRERYRQHRQRLGGGIFAYGYGTTTIQNTTISGNFGRRRRGGVLALWSSGTMTIQRQHRSAGTLPAHRAVASASPNYGTTTIQNSTISGNSSNPPTPAASGLQALAGSTTLDPE